MRYTCLQLQLERSSNLQDPDHMMLKPLQFKTIMYAHIKSNESIIVICLGHDY